MSLPLVFRRAARREFDDAADWYDGRRVGLGAAFTSAVQDVLGRIAVQPAFYPQVFGPGACIVGLSHCTESIHLAEPRLAGTPCS